MTPAGRTGAERLGDAMTEAIETARRNATSAGRQMGKAIEDLVGPPAKRGRGRPAIGELITGFRLDDDARVEVEALAAAAGVTRAEMLRELVGEALAARRRKASKARPNG